MYHVVFQVLNKMWCFTCLCFSSCEQPPGESAFPTGIFAGTKITPDTLVQTLKLEEPPCVSASPTPAQKGKSPNQIDAQ